MDVLTEAVIDWVKGERIHQTRQELIDSLVLLTRHCDVWPIATPRQWNEAIDSAIEQNLITEVDGKVMLATVTEPEPTKLQLELF